MLENEGSELFKDLWKKKFKVLQTTFNYIINQVRDNLERQDPNLRNAAHLFFYKQPVYKQLALGWQIAKQLSGLNPLPEEKITEKWSFSFAIDAK